MEETERIGEDIYHLTEKIFPICRSITGDGVRKTLDIINQFIKGSGLQIQVHEIPSGTQVYDWVIPKEWVIRNGYVCDENDHRIIDFWDNNLHVIGYSSPVDKWVPLEELKKYVHTETAQPAVIPYVTSYYKERFGFCMSQKQLDSLPDGNYHMYIDSELKNGSMTYGELIVPGMSREQEIFFSTYICHPSMANDNCSGAALSASLINYAASIQNRRYTYRFIFIPETIGAIAYLHRNLEHMKNHLIAGFNLSCVGDSYDYSIIHTIKGNTLSDRILLNILRTKRHYTEYPFIKRASDERQYNAPGIDLPVAGFCRSKYGEFPEYHTSADNMDYVSIQGFAGSYDVMTQCIEGLENNYRYCVTTLCEPQLGKRGLYPTVSQKGTYGGVQVLCDILAYADGKRDVIDISNAINVPLKDVLAGIDKLKKCKLLKAV